MRNLQIGNVTVPGIVALGPMAGVTDLPFRTLCKECGADLIYTEMVSAKGIMYNNKNTEALLRVEESERPVALQLFGEDPKIMAEQAKRIEERNFDILDINMGCPVPKVVNNGEGSALMKTPEKVGEIVHAVSSAIRKPVTVKIRKGFGKDDANAPVVAKIAEEAGAAAIAVHGRTREQYYSGKADWDIIKQVKEAVKIPVIGNGDIVDGASAKAMLEQTGCDGLMIGRGAQGNPWIFREILHFLETGELMAQASKEEKAAVIRRHIELQIQYKGEFTGVREMRKHLAWYSAGLPGSARFRNEVNLMETKEELLASVDKIFTNLS